MDWRWTFYMYYTWQTKRLVSVSGLLFAPGTEKTTSYLGPGSYLDLQNSNTLIPLLEAAPHHDENMQEDFILGFPSSTALHLEQISDKGILEQQGNQHLPILYHIHQESQYQLQGMKYSITRHEIQYGIKVHLSSKSSINLKFLDVLFFFDFSSKRQSRDKNISKELLTVLIV